MWVSVKVAQESHKLQEGVQFPHPLLLNIQNMKKKKFKELVQKPLRFHHQDIHEELDIIKEMIKDVKTQMQELQCNIGVTPKQN